MPECQTKGDYVWLALSTKGRSLGTKSIETTFLSETFNNDTDIFLVSVERDLTIPIFLWYRLIFTIPRLFFEAYLAYFGPFYVIKSIVIRVKTRYNDTDTDIFVVSAERDLTIPIFFWSRIVSLSIGISIGIVWKRDYVWPLI